MLAKGLDHQSLLVEKEAAYTVKINIFTWSTLYFYVLEWCGDYYGMYDAWKTDP
jgi:hypothetical protein